MLGNFDIANLLRSKVVSFLQMMFSDPFLLPFVQGLDEISHIP